ncbi:MAG: alpha/beta hydrolase, partial [Alphaproteobacteria bacterium]
MKEPILFVPGMMCDARVFGPQIDDLSRDFTVQIARVAHAESIREMAAEAIHQAPPRFALAGLSMGGIVAMEIIRRVPERVTRIALMSTTPLAETPEQAAWREPQIVKAQAGNLDEARRAALPPESLGPGPGRQRALDVMDAMAADLGVDT